MVSERRGREKLRFLNPVPIRLVHDRWAITDGTTMKVLVGPDFEGEPPKGSNELRGLKSFLETGEYIDTPASLRFTAMSGRQAA